VKSLVEVAEPSLQKYPDLFLERLKEILCSHQECERLEEQPFKKQFGSGLKGTPKRERPTDSDGAQPACGQRRRPKFDLPRRKEEKMGQPLYTRPQKHSQERVAPIMKDLQKSNMNKQKEKKDYLLIGRLSRSEVNPECRIMA
jgi:hypothetical protein